VKIRGESVQIEIKPFMKQLRQGFAIGPRSTMQLTKYCTASATSAVGLLLTLAMAVDCSAWIGALTQQNIGSYFFVSAA
jgi:hypothetical protein